MPLEKVTIEIDVPEGYEAVAFRVPNRKDTWLSHYGEVYSLETGHECYLVDYPRLILRKKWVVPSWLPEDWQLYKYGPDVSQWFIVPELTKVGEIGEGYYGARGSTITPIRANELAAEYATNFIPPPNTNYVRVHHTK